MTGPIVMKKIGAPCGRVEEGPGGPQKAAPAPLPDLENFVFTCLFGPLEKVLCVWLKLFGAEDLIVLT